MVTRESAILQALTAASEAHHEFERGLGHPDAHWATWYAEFMAEWFIENGYEIERVS